jgi:hypothetical protein
MADDKPTQEIPTTDGEPLIVPVPTRGEFDDVVRKVAGLRKRPAGKDQPPEQSESD